jgi:hypothetical protein
MPHPSAPLAALLALASPALAQTVLYETSFDTLDGWTVSAPPPSGATDVRWDVDALPAGPMAPYRSAPASLNFNDDGVGIPWGLWAGYADSPVVDLSVATGPVTLEFWYGFRHEFGCDWDALRVTIVDATNGSFLHDECISFDRFGHRAWIPHAVALDPAWGAVLVRFSHDTLDDWNFDDQGSFVDDLRIVEDCVGARVLCSGTSNFQTRAVLSVSGTLSIAAGDLRLRGEGFTPNTFAAPFAGTEIGTIPVGVGVRCIGASGSVRLPIAPTRDLGAPVWTLDLGAAPLATIAMAGQPLYVQAIYRRGVTVDMSTAIELAPCQ